MLLALNVSGVLNLSFLLQSPRQMWQGQGSSCAKSRRRAWQPAADSWSWSHVTSIDRGSDGGRDAADSSFSSLSFQEMRDCLLELQAQGMRVSCHWHSCP